MTNASEDSDLRDVLRQLESMMAGISHRLNARLRSMSNSREERPEISQPGDEYASDGRFRLARQWHQMRRRARFRAGKHADLFCDPAWDILLDLYINGTRGHLISVSSACLASNAPPTTGLRWVTILEKRGLIARTQDFTDRRRSWLHLTRDGIALIERMLADVAD